MLLVARYAMASVQNLLLADLLRPDQDTKPIASDLYSGFSACVFVNCGFHIFTYCPAVVARLSGNLADAQSLSVKIS